MSTFTNSEDPDEMQQVYTVCKGRKDQQYWIYHCQIVYMSCIIGT